MAAARGDIVFSVAVRAAFKAEAIVALLAVAVVILQHALTAAAKVFDNHAVGGGFAPESVGEAAGRTENLHRFVVALAFRRAHLRRKQIVRVAGVVEDQTVGFALAETQPAADNLLIKADRLGRAQNGDQIDMRCVEAGGQYRHVNQIFDLLPLKSVDQRIALRAGCLSADQRLTVRQQRQHLFGVLYGSGENHYPFAIGGELDDLADNVRRDTLLLLQLAVEVGFGKQAVRLRVQAAEIILHHRHIKTFRRHQKAMLDHIAQRQLIDAVVKQRALVAAHHAVIVETIDPAFAETVGRRGQAQQPQLRIMQAQMRQYLLILAVLIIADAVALIDDQQRKGAVKLRQVARHRLHAAEHHLALALFTRQAGGENIRLQPQRAIFAVVLRHQLFNVSQHQHAASRHARQLGDNQAFTGAGRQHDNRRLLGTAEVVERGGNRFLLIRTQGKRHGDNAFWKPNAIMP